MLASSVARQLITRQGGVAVCALWLAAQVLLPDSALCAQVFVQPTAYVSVESNSNLDLTPGGQPEVTGYIANLTSLIGIATQNSATTIRPRLDYRDYPTDKGDNRLEEYLDFNSYYKGQRSNASISGTLDHRDELNAELTPALYNDVNPTQPTAPQTGRIVTGATRDSAYVVPSYSYSLTPRIAAGVSGLYQKVNYSPNDNRRYVDFDYYQGKAYLVWSFSQRSDLTFGGYGNKYKATRFDSKATAEGGSVDLNTSWSPLLTTRASVVLQRSDIQSQIPPVFNGTVNAWGAALSAAYKAETQQFRTDLSRLITPSGGGSVYVNNQLQLQYDRRVTQRLSLTAAAVYIRSRALTAAVSGNGRDYLRSVVEMKWMMARTWFIQGGYQYTWQKYQVNPDGAANNRFYLRFGYQGLERQW
jgi:hypothetical protein